MSIGILMKIICILKNHKGNIDLQDPEIFEEYYKLLYEFSNFDQVNKELMEYIEAGNFVETAKIYRLIDNNAVNVLVPYNAEVFDELCDEARQNGISAKWISRARPYSINIYRPQKNSRTADFLEPVRFGKYSDYNDADWYSLKYTC